MPIAPFALLPASALAIVKEFARHILRRPVVGIAAAARASDGRWLLIRRADTGTWALPGGTLEWGETLTSALSRELEEESGVTSFELIRVVGVYSRPDRDPRFHAVTVLVEVTVEPPQKPPQNPLEIREARLFREDELPQGLALKMDDLFAAARRSDATALE